MDGVIFKDINMWMELHKKFGTYEQGVILTEKYLHSDYPKLVEEVVNGLWKGRDAKPYFELIESLEYNPGVKDVFQHAKNNNLKSAIISASSMHATRRVQRDHGVDYLFANDMIIRDNKITGEFYPLIAAGNENKAKIIRKLCNNLNISLEETIYIGDSDKDTEAAEIVGLSIAFNSNSEKLKKVSTHTVEGNNLSDVLKYLPQ
jgi:phosphoserine phosphatase